MIQAANKEIQRKIEQFYKYNQQHVFNFWDELSDTQRAILLGQIEGIDPALIKSLFEEWQKSKTEKPLSHNLEKANLVSLKERAEKDDEMRQIGEDAIRKGEAAAFLVAGGQGSRLGFDGPKGAYPATPVKQKTLFQLHAEKLLAVGKRYNTTIAWYIMTSQTNHNDTIKFFNEHKYFGYDPSKVKFFKQDMLPAVDHNGKLLMAGKDRLFMSPNGHGGSIKALWDSGSCTDMKDSGVWYLFYFQVDNVLTQMCDPVFLGYHITHNSEMSNKVVRKSYPEEKIGIICKIDGQLGVVEYSDLDEKNMYAKEEDGSIKFWAGSIASHIINVDFLIRENEKGFKLPYHFAEKNIPKTNKDGKLVEPKGKNGIKFESFVFDALADVESSVSVEIVREDEFSPLKNKDGVDSAETVHRDLLSLYTRWLQNAGIDVPLNEKGMPQYKIEISPLFALDEKELITKSGQIPKIDNDIYID